jgi:hypothetical protein
MKRIVLLVWLLLLPQAVMAADAELVGFFGGYSAGTSSEGLDLGSGTLYGLRFGVSFLRFFGTEIAYTHVGGIEDQLKSFQGTAHEFTWNFLLEFPINKVVPFATVGIGVLGGTSRETASIQTGLAYNVGGGVKLRKLFGPLGFRFDVRYHNASNGLRISAGEDFPSVGTDFDFKFTEVSGAVMLTF